MRKQVKKLVVLAVICSTALIISLSMTSTVENNYVVPDGEYSEYYCGLEKDQLYIEPVKIKTELNDKDAYMYIEVQRKNLVSLDNYGKFTYITYTNDDATGMTEILLAPQLPDEVLISTKKSLITKVFGESNKLNIVKQGNTLKGQQKIPYGYLYTAITSEKLPTNLEFQESVQYTITDIIKYAERSKSKDIVVNINGIGKINLSSISVLKDSPGIYYGHDKILRLYNYNEDIAYVWITGINNSLLMNTIGNLQTTEYNNVYSDKDYRDQEKMGYKTYSIMTQAGIYSIKLNEKAPEGLLEELLTVLKINTNDTKIELPFSLSR